MRGVRGLVLVAAVMVAWPLAAAEDKLSGKADPKDKPAAKDKTDKGDGKDKDKTDKGDGKDKDKPAVKDKPEAKPAAEAKPKLVPVGNVVGRYEGGEKKIKVSIKSGSNWTPVEVAPADDMKVRLAVPPPAFDDKGRLKRYSAKELADLKGPDRRLPGYTGELGDLKNGQYVQLTLVRKAGQPKNRKDAVEMAEYEPKISVILIVNEQSPQ